MSAILEFSPQPTGVTTKLAEDAFIEVLEQYWPVYADTPQDMTVQDAYLLERLYDAFGVPMRVRENSMQVMGRAYDIFVLGFAEYVKPCIASPRAFELMSMDWPQPWRDYVRAVAAQDAELVRALAVRLQPLAPECELPPRLFDALFEDC